MAAVYFKPIIRFMSSSPIFGGGEVAKYLVLEQDTPTVVEVN